MNTILDIQNVSKEYGPKIALNNLNLSIPKGVIFGLLGPNGAGKTTLIRIINQITAPDSGQVLYKEQVFKRKHLFEIGYLPEERGLYKNMKVGQQCLYLAQLKGLTKTQSKQEIYNWFKKLDMLDWLDKKVEQLSKGMAQKVQFVSTVLHQPKLLILDEPFTGFDPINTELIKNEIFKLKEKGISIILSTHRMESVEELCDDIALINSGKCLLNNSVHQIKNDFKKNLFEIHYKGELKAIKGYILVKQDEDYALIKSEQKSNSNHLLQELIKQVEIIHFNEKLPSINDIFIQSIKHE
jgi:ABC-2 type transport system ATP-binding protein